MARASCQLGQGWSWIAEVSTASFDENWLPSPKSHRVLPIQNKATKAKWQEPLQGSQPVACGRA